MTTLAVTPSTLPAMVIALCFAAGLNTYGCVFALGCMARMQWLTLPPGLGGVANSGVMAACGVLFLGEFVADKIPGFDVIWNLLHTFVRVPVAALLAFAAASPLPFGMRMAVTLLGAAFATMAHGSKTALRVAVMPAPEPISNGALSLGEDGIAIGLSWIAMRHPVAGGMIVVGLTACAAGLGWWGFRLIRAGWARRFRDRRFAGEGSIANRKVVLARSAEKANWSGSPESLLRLMKDAVITPNAGMTTTFSSNSSRAQRFHSVPPRNE